MTSQSPTSPPVSTKPVARRQRRRWLILGLALLLSPFAMELAVRAAGQEGLVMHREVGKRIRKAPPPLGHVLKPSAHVEVTFGPRNGAPLRTAVMTTNKLGFRGAMPRGGRPLIACIGDSHTFGFGVNDHETWPAVLGTALRNPSAEVLNFGVGGYGPTNELIRMQEDALPYEPDIVVWQWFMNDVPTEASWRPRSRLRRIVEPWVSPFRTDWVLGLREASVLADLTLHSLYGWCRAESGSVQELATTATTSEGWKATRAELLTARRVAESAGARFVILLQPMMVESQGDFRSAPLDALLLEFCKEENVPIIDMSESLDPAEAKHLRNSDLDYHANARCYGIVGRTVARTLLEWGWL